ncbi:MAG TPA: protein phosphatase 2C domain-containing protein [Anaerolineaceae bacterium]|nr:protein phosphatase 2C domain-containing protein [Anaerolineaceae bacterium]HPN51044.1 protein phosphatase 2C domain-containing protein [Anaerolineaceae bacterium]
MNPSDKPHLLTASGTHPGMTGKNNEDYFGIFSFTTQNNGRSLPVLLAMVCDGIGGHNAGEVAAKLAVDTIRGLVLESDGSDPLGTMTRAIQEASRDIHNFASEDPARQGMGSTCSCAWIAGDRLFINYAGDSRMYLLRGGRIQQLTKDHTWVQEAVDAGVLNRAQAKKHPNAHVIRRHLGGEEPPEVDARLYITGKESDEQALANQGYPLMPGDRLLMCSDGLTDLVEDDEIAAVLLSMPMAAAIEQLIGMACQRGGHDNITIVTAQVPGEPPQVRGAAPTGPVPPATQVRPTGPVLAKGQPRTTGPISPGGQTARAPGSRVYLWLALTVLIFLALAAIAVIIGITVFANPQVTSTPTPRPSASPTHIRFEETPPAATVRPPVTQAPGIEPSAPPANDTPTLTATSWPTDTPQPTITSTPTPPGTPVQPGVTQHTATVTLTPLAPMGGSTTYP